jgi:hypothetical protein
MGRIIEKGVEQIRKDAAAMKTNLEQQKGSRKTLDAIKQRYNVVNSFLLKSKATMPRRSPIQNFE